MAPTPTLTAGKATFHDVYDAEDAAPYMREMQKVGYIIADNAAPIARRALTALCSSGQQHSAAECPVVLELCAGYGLSMAPIRTFRTCPELFDHYSAPRPSVEEALRTDSEFLRTALRKEAPPVCVVGADVATNALAYGKRVGLFDATISTNLEDPRAALPVEAVELAGRAKLVLATGAFSYISVATLGALFSCWGERADPPTFVFFPLVATDMSAIRAFFEAKGMQVYHAPAETWLPQRRHKDEAEREAMTAVEAKVTAEMPDGRLEDHVHATPFFAAPQGEDLARLAVQWIRG